MIIKTEIEDSEESNSISNLRLAVGNVTLIYFCVINILITQKVKGT